MAFASLSVEDMVKTFNMVIAAFRTTTILIERKKSPNNLTVMKYMAELKIMVGLNLPLKFKGSMVQVKWKKLERFIPDPPYWIKRYGVMEDDGEHMTVNYDGVDEVEIPKGWDALHGAGDQLQDGGDIRRMAIYVAVQREGDGAAQGTREH